MKKHILVFILLFLLFFTISYSVSISDFVNNLYSNTFGLFLGNMNLKDPNSCPIPVSPSSRTTLGLEDPHGFIFNSFIAMMASFFLSLILFLFAKITNHPNANSIIATKMSDLFVVLLILISFSIIYNVAYLPSNSLIENYHKYAFEYNGEIIDKLVFSYGPLFLANSFFYALYNFQFPITTSKNNIFGFYLNIGPLLKPLIDLSSIISSFLGIVLGEFAGRYFMLCFIRFTMLPYLLPIGFLLRMFNATKGAGATLIALVISFFIVYPAMLSLNYAVYQLHISIADNVSRVEIFQESLNIISFSSSFGLLFLAGGIIYRLRNVAISGFTPLIQNSVMLFLGGVLLTLLFSFLNLYMELMTIITVYGFLLPALNIFVTLNVARELARTLAIDLDLSAFMKVI